jgi:hypothetical protein
MGLHSIGFSHLRESHAQRDLRRADAFRRRQQRSPVAAAPMLALSPTTLKILFHRDRASTTWAYLLVLHGIGLDERHQGFTCAHFRAHMDNCAHPAYQDALHRYWKRRRWDLSGISRGDRVELKVGTAVGCETELDRRCTFRLDEMPLGNKIASGKVLGSVCSLARPSEFYIRPSPNLWTGAP